MDQQILKDRIRELERALAHLCDAVDERVKDQNWLPLIQARRALGFQWDDT